MFISSQDDKCTDFQACEFRQTRFHEAIAYLKQIADHIGGLCTTKMYLRGSLHTGVGLGRTQARAR